ncbi:MAG: RNA polymerase sigma factor [Methyloligellaceae bacterium]
MPEVQRKGRLAATEALPADPLVALLASVAEGDREAFTSLYAATSDRLLGIAVKMLGHRDLAEEVLQEAFLAVWQKAGSYRPVLGAPMAWLTTIVRHRAIDRLRLMGRSSEIAAGGDTDLDALLPDQGVRPESTILLRKSILECLQGLKQKQRDVILLSFFYGYTHEELSSRTGAPLGTVKSDVRRGLTDLRGCLDR